MPHPPRKRFYAIKAITLTVLIIVGHFLQGQPDTTQAIAKTPAPLISQG